LIIAHCNLISERELMFMFANRYMLSPVRLSPICLSSVCNARAPYSAGKNVRQMFLRRCVVPWPLLMSTKIFTEIVPGETLRRGGRG